METKQIEYLAVDQGVTAGAIVWWRLSGDVDREAVKVVLRDQLELPDELSPLPIRPRTAALRAVREIEATHTFIRPWPGVSRQWAIVVEQASGDEAIDYQVVGRVRCTDLGPEIDEAPPEIRQLILDAYERHLRTLTVADMGEWLVGRVMPHLSGVRLRERGGVYFIPVDRVEEYRWMIESLPGAHRFSEVPAMRSEEAIAAITEAISREVDEESSEMLEEIGTIGQRALANRRLTCAAMLAKITTYERLLGSSLQAVASRVQTLQAAVTAAMLVEQSHEQPSLFKVA